MEVGETGAARLTEGDQAALPPLVRVGDSDLAVWPAKQIVAPLSDSMMAVTPFADIESYHGVLIAAALAAEQDPRFRDPQFRGGCGVKVRKIPDWGSPAGELVHARALMLAHRTLSRRPVYADDSWASVYRAGDYCMPHSHLRSSASIVYMLDPGDDDPDEPFAGRLCFSDARIPVCCPHEPGRVTQLLIPTMTAGTMIIFASDYVHSVNPYRGSRRPRITLSWNITIE